MSYKIPQVPADSIFALDLLLQTFSWVNTELGRQELYILRCQKDLDSMCRLH